LDLNNELEALSQLPQDALDDFDFSDTEGYQDQTGPVPPPTGNYELVIGKAALKRKKNSNELQLQDGKWPIYGIQSATIIGDSQFERAEGLEDNGGGLGSGKTRNIGLLYDVRTKPYERSGRNVSSFVDLLRSFDVASSGVKDINEGVTVLTDFRNQGKSFRVRLDWFAEDYEARKAALAQFGDTPEEQKAKLSKDAYSSYFKKYKATSMKAFERNAQGIYQGYWKSPAGNLCEARLQIVRFYSSLETVRLGPDTVTH
jgi:hypothetical protein